MTATDRTPRTHNRKLSMDNVELSPVADQATRGIVWDSPAAPRAPGSPIGAYYASQRNSSSHRSDVIVETPDTASLDDESGSSNSGRGGGELHQNEDHQRNSLWKAFGWGFVSFLSLGLAPLILWTCLYCQAWRQGEEDVEHTAEAELGTVSELTVTDDDTATRAQMATAHMREMNHHVQSTSKKKIACSVGSVFGTLMSIAGLLFGILAGMKIWPAEEPMSLPDDSPLVNTTPPETTLLKKLRVVPIANPLARCDPEKAGECSAPGEPASASNSNPVELTVLVSSENKAARDLNLGDFGTDNSPSLPVAIHCENFSRNCQSMEAGFQASVGIYKMFLRRFDNKDWIAASYSFPLYVTSDKYENATSLFTFNITEDEPVTSSQEHIVLDASVKTDTCASNLTECMGAGHSIAAASSSNHNPIHMTIKVVWSIDGAAVDDLDDDNFAVSLETAPDEDGSELTIYSFRTLGSVGVYDLFLDRSKDGNWAAGTYEGVIKVAFAGRQGATSFSFQIDDGYQGQSSYTLEATVNTAVCALGLEECTGVNHTEIPTTDDNHNPVQLSVVVKTGGHEAGLSPENDNATASDGSLVSGLGIEHFLVSAISDPNGQPGSFKICDSTICGSKRFVVSSPGFYQILLDRVDPSNWDTGTYTGIVRVENGTFHSPDLSFQFDVPASQQT